DGRLHADALGDQPGRHRGRPEHRQHAPPGRGAAGELTPTDGGGPASPPPSAGHPPAPAPRTSELMKVDLLLRGGTVVDGTGAPPYRGDVAVAGDRIVAVGDLPGLLATRVVEVAGRVVAPGFIDLHTHSDISLLVDPAGQSKVLQGVTTE